MSNLGIKRDNKKNLNLYGTEKLHIWNYYWEHILMHGHHYFRLSLNKIMQNLKIITFTNEKFNFLFWRESLCYCIETKGTIVV